MTMKCSTDRLMSALQGDEVVVARVEGSQLPGGSVRGVLAFTSHRILFFGSGAGRTAQQSFPLEQLSGVELVKSLMTATVRLTVLGASHDYRVKYNDAVPFVDAVSNRSLV